MNNFVTDAKTNPKLKIPINTLMENEYHIYGL